MLIIFCLDTDSRSTDSMATVATVMVIYSSAFTNRSSVYCPEVRWSWAPTYMYFEAVEVNATQDGYYNFTIRSDSYVDVYLYVDSFNPFRPDLNQIKAVINNNSETRMTVFLRSRIRYIFVIASSWAFGTGEFSIAVSSLIAASLMCLNTTSAICKYEANIDSYLLWMSLTFLIRCE